MQHDTDCVSYLGGLCNMVGYFQSLGILNSGTIKLSLDGRDIKTYELDKTYLSQS